LTETLNRKISYTHIADERRRLPLSHELTSVSRIHVTTPEEGPRETLVVAARQQLIRASISHIRLVGGKSPAAVSQEGALPNIR
jgi:hypothetical protein